ncbi:MAG TPA: efflux RND transporter periplasmic adaptor subunit [Ignavibacteriales bacterium]|nr:efflux RND transporter periplasmic adaptor subunit [Ignavibacteriales bacterium]HOL81203.1 efflux RND transporter periplasmic adaptor subunit [Ignavibacteriales bacterium]HOM65306.1 efflux RND transporter periplasmic adaptor subunit [Ignavibacteriales bacterium]HPD68106.1 efflux RND transporter periplasmic adaptor subunit [Ignavibacteriales bacterium]HPP33441.1 efflux RND transporter periplasmic adaptor subunit [Ignavibacteriales bacterium]
MDKKKIILVFPIIIFVIAIIFIIAKNLRTEEEIITGMVEITDVDVASKIPGRIDQILVKEGDYVKKGQLLAVIVSKELEAKLEQAKGVMEAAKAKSQMAHNGARKEEKEAALKLYEQAKAQFEFVQKTYERISKLHKEGLVSQQDKDQIEFQFKAAQDQMYAAKAKLDLVNSGARKEEIEAADALYYQAQNTYNEVLAYMNELKIYSPIDGEIYKKIIDEGEIVNSGYPILNIINPADIWVTIQVREDNLSIFKKGAKFKGYIPALKNEYDFEVYYIAPMAEFATWKPTNQKGEFDLKTFEIKLRPVYKIEGLRPGMSVNIKL